MTIQLRHQAACGACRKPAAVVRSCACCAASGNPLHKYCLVVSTPAGPQGIPRRHWHHAAAMSRLSPSLLLLLLLSGRGCCAICCRCCCHSSSVSQAASFSCRCCCSCSCSNRCLQLISRNQALLPAATSAPAAAASVLQMPALPVPLLCCHTRTSPSVCCAARN